MSSSGSSINGEGGEASGRNVVALFSSGNRLGISHYCEEMNCVSTDGVSMGLEETEDLMQFIKRSLQPSLFLLHPRIACNAPLLRAITDSMDSAPDYYPYKVVKSAAWNPHTAMDLLTNRLIVKDLCASGVDRFACSSGSEKYMLFASVIDLDNRESVASLGAILSFLQDSVMNLENGQMYISKLSSMQLESYMRVSSGTVQALQIFQEDYHPNVIKGPGRSKEGFSLFTMLDRTASALGKECLRLWMAKPLCDKEKILTRQDGIEVLMRPENAEHVSRLSKLLHRVHDMPKLLLRIKKVVATPKDWCKLVEAMAAALHIFEEVSAFYNHAAHDMDRRFIQGLLSPEDVRVVRAVYAALHFSVDVEGTLASGEICILPEYSAELDDLTATYNNLEVYLTEAAKSILQRMPLLNHVAVEYVPQIGYLAAISIQDANFLNSNDFKMVYEMEEKGFFKCSTCYDLDDRIGDIKGNISDLKKKIILSLEEGVVEAESSVVEVSVSIGVLDATLSLATVAIEMKFTRPEISLDPVLVIKNGRHPLSELAVDVFVPNDTYLTRDTNVAIISGENGSGKSVYLKQVGILVYLAHLGSWIPCEKAIVGLSDRLISRISSVETSFSPLSAFSLDLTQMGQLLRDQSPRSLCLIDEFGKGTAPTDGMALLAACIKYFAERSTKAVFVLHFTEVFTVLDLPRYPNVETFRMVIHHERYGTEDAEDVCITPLYTLQVGISNSSGGIDCARSAGVNKGILKRAEEIKKCVENEARMSLRHSKKKLAVQKKSNLHLLKFFLNPKRGGEGDWASATNEAVDKIITGTGLM